VDPAGLRPWGPHPLSASRLSIPHSRLFVSIGISLLSGARPGLLSPLLATRRGPAPRFRPGPRGVS
jgi:hypothetical protein